MSIIRLVVIAWIALLLTACSTGKSTYAPVVSATIEPVPKSGVHRVQRGETLYSIAWNYGLDYRYLVQRNNISSPYHIYYGQRLYLKGPVSELPVSEMATKTAIEPQAQKVVATAKLNEQTKSDISRSLDLYEPTAPVTMWRWPAKGPVLAGFSSANKGINIGGHKGDPVFATATGKVVYSGNGIRGYGNLIIIKHNSFYLTAYAHNSVLLAKEGDKVKGGQKIAEIGHSGTRRTMLHFEIRKEGQPVNPLKYLRYTR